MPFADDRRLSRPLWVYCISVLVAALAFLLVSNLRRSRPGRALTAVRDDHTSAAAMGVGVAAHRALAFAISALCGAVAGSLLMMSRPLATDGMFDTEMSIFLFVSLVIGGAATPSGALVGAFVYVFVPYYLGEWAIDQDGMPPGVRHVIGPVFAELRPTGGAPTIFFGCALVLVMYFAPGGFVAGVQRLRELVVRVEPRRPRPTSPTVAGRRG
jgi:branched-chain amino acid transport system permease protein